MPRRQEDVEDEGFGETSRYTAHLDRGWSLLDRGDYQRARNSAHQALKLRPDVPDAAMLMAAISLAESDPEGSLEWYERAIEADAEYVDAQLAAAQVLLYDLDEPQRALLRAETARDLEEATVADLIEFGLLEVEALVALHDLAGARERLAGLSELSLLEQLLSSSGTSRDELRSLLEEFVGEPVDLESDEWQPVAQRATQLALRVARLHLDFGGETGAETAMPWLELLLRVVDQDPEVWYLANEAAHLAGDPIRAAHAALQVLQLDATVPLPDWAPTPSDLHVKVVDLLVKCPDPQLQALAREPSFVVLVNDAPPYELCLEGVDPRARALALAARKLSELESTTTLTGLALYHRNLVRFARDRAALDREIELAVFDELAVFFGFDDARRERLELPPSELIHPMGGAHGEARARRELETEDRRKLAKAKPKPEASAGALDETETVAEPPAKRKKKASARKAKAGSKKARATDPAGESAKPESKRKAKTKTKTKAKAKASKVLESKAKTKADDKRPRKRPLGEPPEE